MRLGDVITALNGKPIHSLKDVNAALDTLKVKGKKGSEADERGSMERKKRGISNYGWGGKQKQGVELWD